MHRGVENDREVIDGVAGGGTVLFHLAHDPLDDFVQTGDDSVLHRCEPLGVRHRIGYPRHNIFAVGDLGVHHGLGVDYLTCAHITEIADTGRRSYVDSQSVTDFDRAGFDLDDLLVHPDGEGRHPVFRPYNVLEVPEHRVIEGKVL